MWFSTISVLLIMISCIYSAVNITVRNRQDSLIYLNKYGYNLCSTVSKTVACSPDYSSLLRKFQEQHDLKQSGVRDASTIRQMNQPRCANEDIKSSTSSGFKWSRSSLTWSLRSYPPQISKSRAQALVRDAFNVWLAHIPLQVSETCSTCSADLKIDFGRNSDNSDGGKFDGSGGSLAYAFPPENGTIRFDSDEQWTEAYDGSGINFYSMVVHEIGHALGLHHINNRESIMYPSYSLFRRGRMLSEYDRQSIQRIYGTSNPNENRRKISPVTAQQLTKKVVFIIADGIPADVIENAAVPNLRKIQKIGQYTRAYVGGEKSTYSETATISAAGYMNLLTGTWGNKHNVFDNDVQAPNYHYKNIFRLLKEQKPEKKIAIFSTWIDNRIKLIGERLPTAGNIMFDYKFDGYELNETVYPHDSEKHYIHDIDQRVSREAALCIRTQGPDLSWVYLQYTDDVGHRSGIDEQFYDAVNDIDKQIGQIWQAIDYRMTQYNEDWLIIITTDHGRDPFTGGGHGGQSDRERTTWIVMNSQVTNSYFREFQPGIIDILPTIARFMNVKVPRESERELDGIPLIGKVSLVQPETNLNDSRLIIRWKVVDREGNVNIWLSMTNSFKDGISDMYQLIETVPIDQKMVTVDMTRYQSEFYKIVLEGPYNMVNKWIFRSGAGDCDGSRCGCYNRYCWAYVDADQSQPGDWWCYTQKAGVFEKREMWQTCLRDSDCSWDRSCGSCRQYRGNEISQRNVC